MRISEVSIRGFRRFANLRVVGIPTTARIVILAGPNGMGKSSLFDAFKVFHGAHGQQLMWDPTYHLRDQSASLQWNNCVEIAFNGESIPSDGTARKRMFYFRSAYRNDPEFTLNGLNQVGSVVEERRFGRMIETDAAVMLNYQRLAANVVQDIFHSAPPNVTVAEFRESAIGEIRDSIARLFPGLVLSGIGNPLQRGTFRFNKGSLVDFEYKNLSGGEKAAFDLILDLVIKRREYQDTVYCIDEPEAHMNTQLQGRLFRELADLIPDGSQLWLATHSIGMLNEARKIEQSNPGSVAFLNFQGHDFDTDVIMYPSRPTRPFWESVLHVALDELSDLVAPQEIVVCEGSNVASRNVDHDARCYNQIFADEFPDAKFVSGGNSSDVASDKFGFVAILPNIVKGITVKRLIDRDDHALADVALFATGDVRVLSRRNLQSYLWDDEVLTLLCNSEDREDAVAVILQAKRDALLASRSRGNAPDDLKSASGDLYVVVKKTLGLTGKGNDARAFEREVLAPLLKRDTKIYSELREAVFPITAGGDRQT